VGSQPCNSETSSDRQVRCHQVEWPEKRVDDGIMGFMTDSTGRNRRDPVGTGVMGLTPPS
jgi:hypothetical protein